MKVFDPRALAGGLLPLLHFDYDDPRNGGPGTELDLRYALLACRIHGATRPEDTGRPTVEKVIPDGEWGDVTGSLLWYPGEDRPIGSFSWAWPSIAVAPSDDVALNVPQEPFGREGGVVNLRPLTLDKDRRDGTAFELWEADERYRVLPTGIADGMPLPALNMHGITGMASDEGRQTELWMMTDPRLVAPHRGGVREMGSVLADVRTNGSISTIVYGHAQTLLRVTEADRQFQWSLNCAPSPIGGGGFGLFYVPGEGSGVGPGIPCFASHLRKDGWFHGGHKSADKHRDHLGADGWVNPLHSWWKGNIYKNVVEDGPVNWTVYQPGIDHQVIKRVHAGFNFPLGKWDFWTTDPIIPPPEKPPPTDDPPDDPDEPPITPGEDPPTGPPVWPGPGDPNNPGGGDGDGDDVGNPWILEGELLVMSLIIGGTPDRDSQGRNGSMGGLGKDTEGIIDASGRAGEQAIEDAAKAADEAIQDAVDAAAGLTNSGEPGGTGDPDVEPDEAEPAVPPSDPLEGLRTPGSDLTRSIEFDDSAFELPSLALEREYIPGRRGALSEFGIARGGPTPLSAHLWAMPQVDVHPTRTNHGTWAYKSEPGTPGAFGNGTAKAAALFVGPMALSDGIDDQSAWLGELDFFLYNGDRGGSQVRRFGWATYRQTTDNWSDGVVMEPDSGRDELSFLFRDTAGAGKVGTVTFGSLTAPVSTCVFGTTEAKGALKLPPKRVTSDTTLTATDPWNVFVNTDGGNVTISLPQTPADGTGFRIVNTGSGTVTIDLDDATDDLLGITNNTFTLSVIGEVLIVDFDSTDGYF